MSQKHLNITIALGLVGLAVLLRLLPHPANFAPVTAVAIFGGAMLPRKLGLWVPLAAMIISDAVIGFYNIMPVIWVCYALIALASSFYLRRPNWRRGATLTVSASVFFFGVTNFAVWLWSGMYAHSLAGLGLCYEMALPFFRNTALSDAFYTAALFGFYALARLVAARLFKPLLQPPTTDGQLPSL
jgi:hypothetical protein